MLYSILNNKIEIEDLTEFNPGHIVECGQLFRYYKTETGYKIFSKNLFCGLIYDKTRVIIDSADAEYFVNYFDLNRNYSDIKLALSGYPNLKKAINYGGGVRILNQDPAETVISFIISANNNIPRIRQIIGRLCDALGEDMGGYRAFPTPEALAARDAAFYRSMGAGYRADYIVSAAKMISDGHLEGLEKLETPAARKKLLELPGVGPKVADCVLLFAYHRTDTFPTDVWIEKVYDSLFGGGNLSRSKKSEALLRYYGELSGYAQQYLFYYARENNIINPKMEEKQ